jgi:hypothetical protein
MKSLEFNFVLNQISKFYREKLCVNVSELFDPIETEIQIYTYR